MWGWANESLPPGVTKEVAKVRAFGAAENIAELKEEELPDDECLGWRLTAVAAKVLGAKGAYRCPGKNGFVYVAYSSIEFAKSELEPVVEPKKVECRDHGTGFAAHAREHLVSNPAQRWFSPMRNTDGLMHGAKFVMLSSKSRVKGMKGTNQKSR